jgi:hypothetical protein
VDGEYSDSVVGEVFQSMVKIETLLCVCALFTLYIHSATC